jgi:hypothetical protein
MVRRPAWHQNRKDFHRPLKDCPCCAGRRQSGAAAVERSSSKSNNCSYRGSCTWRYGRPRPNQESANVPSTTVGSRKWESASERTKDPTDICPSDVPLWTANQTSAAVRSMRASSCRCRHLQYQQYFCITMSGSGGSCVASLILYSTLLSSYSSLDPLCYDCKPL